MSNNNNDGKTNIFIEFLRITLIICPKQIPPFFLQLVKAHVAEYANGLNLHYSNNQAFHFGSTSSIAVAQYSISSTT